MIVRTLSGLACVLLFSACIIGCGGGTGGDAAVVGGGENVKSEAELQAEYEAYEKEMEVEVTDE